MGIKMDLGSSDSQANSAAAKTMNRVAAYQAALDALNNFANDDRLSGAAYSNAKNYAKSLLAPLFQAAILFEEGKSSSVGRVPSRYRTDVGGESLDQDILEEQIRVYNETIDMQNAALELKMADKVLDRTTISSIQSSIGETTRIRDELQEKLNKLIAFDATSASLFSEIPSLESAVDQGLAQMSDGFANFSGNFTLPLAEQLAWTQTVNTAWEERGRKRDYQEVLLKISKGEELSKKELETIQSYAAKHPDEEVPQSLLDYLIQNKKSISNNFALDVLTNGIEQTGIGLQRLGGIATILEGIKGPATFNAAGQSTSFVMSKSNGLGQALVSKGGQIANVGKFLGYGMMGIGFGYGMYDDLVNEKKTVGEAIAHNGTSLGVGVLSGLGTTAAVGFFVSNPVGWTVAGVAAVAVIVSTAASSFFEYQYQTNKTVHSFVDGVGHGLDITFEGIGKGMIESSKQIIVDSMNPMGMRWLYE